MTTYTRYISSLESTCLAVENELAVDFCEQCPFFEQCEEATGDKDWDVVETAARGEGENEI